MFHIHSAGSKFDKLSREGKAFAAGLNQLAWRQIACWGALRIRPRRADDTHSVARVEVYRAGTPTHDYYLVTESYDGRVELASIHTNKSDAAEAFAFHVRMINPLRWERGLDTQQYRTFEEMGHGFASLVRGARQRQNYREAEARARVKHGNRAA